MEKTPPTSIYWVSPDPVDYTYNGTPRSAILGNYWGSDYSGSDADGNGIGDEAFTIPDSLGNDTAPLMGIWQDGTILDGGPATIPPSAGFTATPTSGQAPMTVTLTSYSSGPGMITSWAWDFENDGIVDSTEQNPSHIYTAGGLYTVNLTVTGPAGSDTVVKTDYITVISAGADLTASAGPTSASSPYPALLAHYSPNTISATITNIGTEDAAGFDVTFLVDGNSTTVNVPEGLAAGNSTVVNVTDSVDRHAGDSVPITITVDAGNVIAESDETNNQHTYEAAVIYNGYAGWRWGDGPDITTKRVYNLHGDILTSLGNSQYTGVDTSGTTVTWTAEDLPIPAGTTVKDAYLYVPYTWDKRNWYAPDNVTTTFNEVTIPYATHYVESKNWGSWPEPYGLLIYNVTDQFDPAGNHASMNATGRSPYHAYLPIRGMNLVVTYEDANATEKLIFLNDGFDMLFASPGYYTTPETATAYAPFTGAEIDMDRVEAATLTTSVSRGSARGTMLFNGVSHPSYWAPGQGEIGLNATDVTQYLSAADNTVMFRSQNEGLGIEAYLAILKVEYQGEATTPVANFTTNVTDGNVPLTAHFTDTTTGGATAWSWDFGDGATSTEQSPVHTYVTAGTYTVSLTATGPGGSNTETKKNLITVGQPLTSDNYNGGIPLTTVQEGTVSGGLWYDSYPGFATSAEKTFTLPDHTDIQWARLYVDVYCGHMQNNYRGNVTIGINADGDDTYETQKQETFNTTYSFPGEDGTGPVWLNDHMNRVTSDYLMWYDLTDAIKGRTVNVQAATKKIDSSFDGRIKAITLVVAYDDGDTDQVQYWVNQGHDTVNPLDDTYTGSTTFATAPLTGGWASANLTAIYLASQNGAYTFRGTELPSGTPSGSYFGTDDWDVSGLLAAGQDSTLGYHKSDNNYYKIPLALLSVRDGGSSGGEAPVAQFSTNVTSGAAPLAVQFTDSSTNTPTSWAWDFGDNATSAEQHPVHTYTAPGTYTVNLTATNAAGSNTETKTSYITVNEPADPCDLTIAGIVNPVPASAVFAKEPNPVKIRNIKNNGPGVATNIPVALYASDVSDGTVPINTTTIDSLASGAQITIELIDPTIRNLEGGTVTYTAAVDPENTLTETDKTNNNKTSPAKPVRYNGYKGKGVYWEGGSNVTTKQTYDLRGDIVYAAQPASAYKAVGWTDRTETWTADDLPIPAGATVENVLLYVAYNWDQTPEGVPNMTATFNGNTLALGTPYLDKSNFGGYADYEYGLYPAVDVTDLFVKGGDNTLVMTPNAGNKQALYPSTLAVVYRDPTATRKQIFLNEECDELGYSEASYGTTMEEATAYVPFSGMAIETATVQKATLHSFVGSAGPEEGNLFFNGATVATKAWRGNANTCEALVADVTAHLTATGNEAAVQGTESGGMCAYHQFLVVEYAETAPAADFNATPTAGDVPLTVQFTDLSTGAPTSWAWDFGDNMTSDQQHPVHTYTAPGTYTVNLTVTNAAGSDANVKTDYITSTVPTLPDLAVSTLTLNTPKTGEVFSAAENTYTATITNIGTADAGNFTVEFNVTGATGTVAVDGLAAGANTTVTWTDETVREAGDPVTVTVTADAENSIAESNKENNIKTAEKTVVPNGYRGKRLTGGEDITTAATYDVRGDLVYSSGTSAYLSASTGWTDHTVAWTAGDLAVPENATITAARLYVPYTWDKGPVFPANVTLTFNGETVDQAAFYEDEKLWGTSYPYGMTVYDVTETFSTDGNTAVLANAYPGGGNVSVRGMLLAVVYDDGTTAPHTVIMNEGFDLLYGGEAQATTPEQATAYAPFTLNAANAASARLVTVAPGAGPTEGDLLFNDEEWTRVWNYTGTTQIGVDDRDVTAFLAGENLAGFRSDADYMEAAAAFLVVEYAPEPGSIAVTSTPTGAAVWLDGTETGEVTDCLLTDVPPGDHVVTLTREGYANASAPVTVVSGETAAVALELTTLTGSLAVTSTPDGAAILIDGAETGEVTNTTLDGIAVGTHAVTLRKDGYADASAEVAIEYNATASCHLDLVEAIGSIAVTSTPTGAAIFLDGAETGQTTDATLTGVPAGEHTVTVKKPGYADATTTVTVDHGETVPVHFGLVPPTGSILVTSTPDGARVFLDDLETGEMTNATLVNVLPGEHTVRLELDGYLDAEETVTVTAGGTASCHRDLEKIVVLPVAAFSAAPTSGDAPLGVRFTDASTGNATSWAWDFGDGTTSTEQNPVHTYLTAGTYAVGLRVTNEDGSNSTTKTDCITVTLLQGDQTVDTSLEIPGCIMTPGSDGTQLEINTTETGARVTGNRVTIPQENYTLTIETEGVPGNESGTITGTVVAIRLDTQPVITELASLGTVSASVSANLTGLPAGAGLTTTVSQDVAPDARTAFHLAASGDGLNLGDVAYTLNIVRTNLENAQDIAGATIRMTVSPAWVADHGGVNAIRIIRSAEDGTNEVLATRLVGTDASGNLIFEAVSPNGLSVFGLAAVSAAPQATQSSSSGSGGGGHTSTAVDAASNLKPGERVTLAMDQTAVSAVTLTANHAVNDVMVTMAKGTLPRATEPPAGTVYQYVEATLYKAAEEDFSGVQLRFAVPSDWLAAQGCTAGQIGLFRYTDDGWQAVPVEVLGEESGKAVFAANPNGFGLFAIAATGQASSVTEDTTPEPTATEAPVETVTTTPPADTTPTPQPTPLPLWTAVLALGVVLLVMRKN